MAVLQHQISKFSGEHALRPLTSSPFGWPLNFCTKVHLLCTQVQTGLGKTLCCLFCTCHFTGSLSKASDFTQEHHAPSSPIMPHSHGPDSEREKATAGVNLHPEAEKTSNRHTVTAPEDMASTRQNGRQPQDAKLDIPVFRLVSKLEDAKPIRAVKFHPAGSLFAVGSNSGILRICRSPTLSKEAR